MKLTWIGHSCFKIEQNGFTVITDPYQDNAVPGLSPVREAADLVVKSHDHFDHCAIDLIEQKAGGVNPFTITEVASFHDNQQGAQRGTNTIHIFEGGGLKIAHFGDIGCTLNEEQAAALSGLDVALLPVGGFFTVDAAAARQIVEQIRPRIVIPMHFRGETFGFDKISTVEPFLELCETVEQINGSSIDPDAYADAAGLVIVLRPRNA